MPVEGKVSVLLSVADGKVATASVKSMRPMQLPKVLTGRRAEEATQMVSLLYRICAEAQASASVAAIESAAGIEAGDYNRRVRSQLLNMEIVHEHLWRILLDWPVLTGGSPDRKAMSAFMGLSGNWKTLLNPDRQAYRPGADLKPVDRAKVGELCVACETILSEAVFSMPAAQWLMQTAEEMLLWAAEEKTVAARALNELVVNGWAATGSSDIRGLPDMAHEKIDAILSGPDAESFICRPQLNGNVYETTAFSRCRAQPLIAGLTGMFGPGLLARYAAVLVEVAMTMAAMKSSQTDDDGSLGTIMHGSGSGIGVVEAARGRLMHRVGLADGVIERYHIVAPTEWNFHPGGALVKGLEHLDGRDLKRVEQQAHLLICAMDPCVSYSLEVKGHA